ncbi:hypothetical protein DENSPDRAFT_884503 [Dentipellis sp. KUC8613]|nr:hypothetical protein DENSPDRAFT_884503 [Dentipellis sp. KUC8613]
MASLVRDGGLLPAVLNGSAIAPVLMGWFGPAPLLIPPNPTKHPSCSLDDSPESVVPPLPVCIILNGTLFQHATEGLSAFTFSDTLLDIAIPPPTTTLFDITAPSSSVASSSAVLTSAPSSSTLSSPAPSSGILPRLSQEQPPPSSVPEEPPAPNIFDILLLIGFCTLVIALLVLSLHPCTPIRSLASDFTTFISSALIDIHTLPYRWVACAEEKAALLRLIGTLDQKAKKFARQLLAMEDERHAAFFRETALEDSLLVLADDLAVLQHERKVVARTLRALRNSLLESSTPEPFDSATDDLQTNLRELEIAVESQIQVRLDNKDLLDTVMTLRGQLEERQQLLEQRDSQIATLQKELSARPVFTKPVENADNATLSTQPDEEKPRSQPAVQKPRPQPEGEKKLSWREKRYGPKKGKSAAKGSTSTSNGQGSAAPSAQASNTTDSTIEFNGTSSSEAPGSSVAEEKSVIATSAVESVSSHSGAQSSLPKKPAESISGDGSKATSSAPSLAPPLLLPAREGGSGCNAGEMWSTSASGQPSQPVSGNARGHPQPGPLPPRPQFHPPPFQRTRPPPHPFPYPPPYPYSHQPAPHQFPPRYVPQYPHPPQAAFYPPTGHPMPRYPPAGFRGPAGPFNPSA